MAITASLTHATPVVRTADYDRAKKFYEERLGFDCVEEGGDPPRFGIFERQGARIFVNGWPSKVVRGEGWDAYFHVHRLDGWIEQIRARGLEVPAAVVKPYGQREIELADPDGNRLCFGEATEPNLAVEKCSYVLAVHDLDVTQDWYERVLGCRSEVIVPDQWLFLHMGSATFRVGHCPDAAPASSLGDHSYLGYIIVRNVDQLAQRFRQHEADIVKPLRDEPWGMREIGVRTVDGHRFMFAERVEAES